MSLLSTSTTPSDAVVTPNLASIATLLGTSLAVTFEPVTSAFSSVLATAPCLTQCSVFSAFPTGLLNAECNSSEETLRMVNLLSAMADIGISDIEQVKSLLGQYNSVALEWAGCLCSADTFAPWTRGESGEICENTETASSEITAMATVTAIKELAESTGVCSPGDLDDMRIEFMKMCNDVQAEESNEGSENGKDGDEGVASNTREVRLVGVLLALMIGLVAVL